MLTRLFCATALLGVALPAMAGPLPHPVLPLQWLSASEIPSSRSYTGTLTRAARFTDARGEHVVVLSETPEGNSPQGGPDERDAALQAQMWRKTGEQWSRIWQVRDHVRNCPLDIACQFVKNSLQLTDIDGNGTAEVSFAYTRFCAGDVSPAGMKLLLMEDATKYIARGTERIEYTVDDETVTDGGEMSFDVAFNKAPPGFKAYVSKRWNILAGHKLP